MASELEGGRVSFRHLKTHELARKEEKKKGVGVRTCSGVERRVQLWPSQQRGGTIVRVSGLFHYLPVRLKRLKQKQVKELEKINTLLLQYSLLRPGIRIFCSRPYFSKNAQSSHGAVLSSLFGGSTFQHLEHIQWSRNGATNSTDPDDEEKQMDKEEWEEKEVEEEKAKEEDKRKSESKKGDENVLELIRGAEDSGSASIRIHGYWPRKHCSSREVSRYCNDRMFIFINGRVCTQEFIQRTITSSFRKYSTHPGTDPAMVRTAAGVFPSLACCPSVHD